VSCSFFQSGSDNFIAFIDDCFYTIMVYCSCLSVSYYIFTVYCISEIPSVLARGKTLMFLKIIIIFARTILGECHCGGDRQWEFHGFHLEKQK
jgi:hypothetical protein